MPRNKRSPFSFFASALQNIGNLKILLAIALPGHVYSFPNLRETRVLNQPNNSSSEAGSTASSDGLPAEYIIIICFGIVIMLALVIVCVCKAGEIARCINRWNRCLKCRKGKEEEVVPKIERTDSYKEKQKALPILTPNPDSSTVNLDKSTERKLIDHPMQKGKEDKDINKRKRKKGKHTDGKSDEVNKERKASQDVDQNSKSALPPLRGRSHRSSVNVVSWKLATPETEGNSKIDQKKKKKEHKGSPNPFHKSILPEEHPTSKLFSKEERNSNLKRTVHTIIEEGEI